MLCERSVSGRKTGTRSDKTASKSGAENKAHPISDSDSHFEIVQLQNGLEIKTEKNYLIPFPSHSTTLVMIIE